jgi:hypothetical protein
VALITAACTGSPPAEPTPASSDFGALAASALADAQAANATSAQLDAIRTAIDEDSVTLETVATAVSATFDCFAAPNVRYEDHGSRVSGGVTYIDYVYEAGDKEPAAEACMKQNSEFIEMLYALQPSALETKDAAFIAAMPGLIQCLRDLGYEVDVDVTADELQDTIAGEDSELETPEGREAAGKRARCAADHGIDGW